MSDDRKTSHDVHDHAVLADVPTGLSRRQLLGTALASGLAAGLLPAAAHADATGANTARPGAAAPRRLVADTRTLEVNGRPAKVFGLIGPDGQPGLRLDPGEAFHVALLNRTGARSIVHWHGQVPPWMQDGFPWPQTPPFANGATQVYDYTPIAGTYWMHGHHDMQEQSLLAAPLIVQDAAAAHEDRQEIVLMLHDFTFRTPVEVLAGLLRSSPAAAQAMAERNEAGLLPPAAMSAAAGPGHRMTMPGTHMTAMDASNAPGTPMAGMAGMSMGTMPLGRPSMQSMSMAGAPMAGMPMDLNDVRYDAFLANDRTLADPAIVGVEHGGRVRLRVINGAASSQFWLDLGGLTGRVAATDGHPVQPIAGRSFPLAIAQRLDILLDLPSAGAFPILAQLEGTPHRTGIVLATPGARIPRLGDAMQATAPVDMSLETRLRAVVPLPPRAPDLVHRIVLAGSMRPYAWSMNGQYWPRITPLMLRQGQRVEIELINQTMMAHPIHLHGHVFQVVAIDGRRMPGAVRDTVLVMPMQRVRIAFDANNPGRWPFHCHNLYHMETGMMTEFRYHGIAV